MSKAVEFESVRIEVPSGNTFDLSHDVKMTGRFGLLMPCLAEETMPGDKWRIGCDALARFMPLISPMMHRVDLRIEYFFVPRRLVWENWQKFIVNDPALPAHPFITIDGSESELQQRLLDCMGIPPHPGGGAPSVNIDASWFAAYQLIYNEYYRDQNLAAEWPYQLTDGSNNAQKGDLLEMHRRAFEHDQFTSCLPFAQKGAAVDIPLGVVQLTANWQSATPPTFRSQATGANSQEGYLSPLLAPDSIGVDTQNPVPPNVQNPIFANNLVYDPAGTLGVDATTINDLRTAFRLQEWLEKQARGGSRYIESILSHFGVKSSDARLQRPEYIVGVKQGVVISEVLNTTGETLPQGNMAGHGISVIEGNNGDYYCEEHGMIIGIVSIMPKTAYSQGIPRKFSKFDVFDYPWPSFAHLGEEPVLNKEIYAYTAQDNEEFGYLPRYYDMKQSPSRIAGSFRGNLNYWHLGREFNSLPTLSQPFIECNDIDEDFTRVFAVETTDDYILMNIVHNLRVYRKLPIFSTPSL